MGYPQDQHDQIEHNLTLHPPKHPAIGEMMDGIRSEAKALGHLIVDAVPPSRELSMALTALEELVAHTIGGIARNQDRVLGKLGIQTEPEAVQA